MQFGVSTHLYHDARLDRDHLVEIAAHGFSAVEIFATRTHVDYHDAQVLADLSEHLRDSGLRAHSVHAPITESLRDGVWGPAYSLATTDEARANARGRRDHRRAARGRAARRPPSWSCTWACRWPSSRMGGTTVATPSLRSLDVVHAAAAGSGVRLALEVIPNPISDADALVTVIEEELDATDIGICLDSGHAFLMGDLVDAIEEVAGHLVTTHLHDNRRVSDDHLVPFDGAIDWAEAAMTLQKVGYEGVWLFELAATDTPRRVLERAQSARRRLERFLSV